MNLNQKIRHKTDVSGTKDVEMINRLNYLSNFWIFFHLSLLLVQQIVLYLLLQIKQHYLQ